MTVVVFEEDLLKWFNGHAQQSGRSFEEKQSFYDELKCELDMHEKKRRYKSMKIRGGIKA